MIQPILPLWVLLPVPAVLLGVAIWILIRRKDNYIQRIGSFLRLTAIAALVCVIGIRPMKEYRDAEVKLSNLDVLFVVDNTLSMYANDYNGRERMNGAVADISYIMDRLVGANFALITFDDRSYVRAPFTQDVEEVRDRLGLLIKPDRYGAKGTDMNAPKADLESLLISSSRKENRKTIFFFLGDGEITRDIEMASYSDLARYISGGAVMGYGTEDGGNMYDEYGSKIFDWETFGDAVSCIDEASLNAMAADLGVPYVRMSASNRIDPVLSSVQAMSGNVISKRMDITNYRDLYFLFVPPLMLLLLWELVLLIRKGRL